MSKNRQQVDHVIERSVEIAKEYNLKYVTTDELFYATIEYDPINRFMQLHGVNTSAILETMADNFANSTTLERIQSVGESLIRSNSYEKLFVRARGQSMFFEKAELDIVDVLHAFYTSEDGTSARFIRITEQAGGDVRAIVRALEEASRIEQGRGKPGIVIQNAKSSGSINTDKGEKLSKENQDILGEFCTNLNELAIAGKIDPVVGREIEVEKIVQVLGRKNKQNVIIVGESGTGKTAIVDGFVNRIVNKEVPEEFYNATVYSLDMGGLVAGTKFRGEFEERLKKIIDAIQKDPKAILFIDEIHMIRGAGSASESAMDASNILKPALATRAIRVIGATTHDEYRKHFEKDKALMRRFHKMDIDEPSVAETKQILRGAIGHFEKFHNLKYDLDALDLAVDLAHKYMHDKKFPDKAFDIVDSVGSRTKLFDKDHKVITKDDIQKEVSIMAKIPDISQKEDDTDKLQHLEENLKAKIFGQDHAIKQLVDYVLMAKSGLREAEKPLLSALLRGQTGCGKTELAKQLSNELGMPLVRFDMSEYQEKHSVSKFVGSPPGYVGFGEGTAGSGLLINAIETNPNCVLLLDEIEKSHPDVLNILLQVMDYGMLTSSTGKTVSFRNAIILMSSNLGAKQMDKTPIGFGKSKEDSTADVEATNEFFAPEFRNRLDVAVTFNRLSKEVMLQIISKFIQETNNMLKAKKVSIVLTESAKDHFVDETVGKNLGARPLASMISKEIKQPLSKKLLFSKLPEGSVIKVDYVDGEIVLKELVQEEVLQTV